MRVSELLRPVRLPPQEKRELEPIRNSCATIRLCQMSLDGSLADLEPARDLLVACPLTDQIRDHALALGGGIRQGKDLRRRAQPMDRSEAVHPVEPGESQIENQDLRLEVGRDPRQGPWLGDRADSERLLKSLGPEPATLGQDAGNDDGDLPAA